MSPQSAYQSAPQVATSSMHILPHPLRCLALSADTSVPLWPYRLVVSCLKPVAPRVIDNMEQQDKDSLHLLLTQSG